MAKIYQVDKIKGNARRNISQVHSICRLNTYNSRDSQQISFATSSKVSVAIFTTKWLSTHTSKQSADEQRNETPQSNPTQTENTEYGVPQLYICDMVRCYSITVYQEVNNRMTSVASEIHTVSVSAGSNIIIINSYVSTIGKRILIWSHKSYFQCRTVCCYSSPSLRNGDYNNNWLLMWDVSFL
jgi:hypothetical protein